MTISGAQLVHNILQADANVNNVYLWAFGPTGS